MPAHRCAALAAMFAAPLALGEITGKGALYETPSEFIRDLIRRHMERTEERERGDVRALLVQSLNEGDYADWTRNVPVASDRERILD